MDILLPQVLTQIVGFLLLLWLLKKYAWGPILQQLEDRRTKIASDLSDVAASKEAALKALSEYESRMREIEKEAAAKIQQGILEGEKIGREMVAAARKEADLLLEKGKENIVREMGLAKMQLRNEVADLVISTTEKVLRKRMDAAQNRELVLQYMDEVK